MKFGKKMKRLLITTGLVLAFGLFTTGCSSRAAVPAESTQVETVAETEDPYSLGNKDVAVEQTLAPTVALLDEQDGAQVGVTAEGETQYAFDKYGPLGKEVWDQIAFQWTSHGLNSEDELRLIMDATYGNMSTKEELTQDILALTQDPLEQDSLSATSQSLQPTQEVKTQETKAQETQQETQAPKQEAPKQEQTQAQETQAPPQQETPAPQQQVQEQAPQQNNGLIPGTNLPSTGDPQVDAALAEMNRQQQERGGGGGADIAGADQGSTSDQGAGLNWN